MRNGKYHIKISFKLRFIAREWQDWLWFSERQPPVNIVFLLLNEELFWILLCKIISDRNFTQENWFWKWIWKTMGEVDLDFKWAISLFLHNISSTVAVVTIKIWSHQPSRNRFSKAPSASSMLILSRESKFALHFSSVRGRVTAIFNSNLTTWKEKIIWTIQFAKTITACIFASARRWRKIISECPPRFAMSLCSQASLLSSKLTK